MAFRFWEQNGETGFLLNDKEFAVGVSGFAIKGGRFQVLSIPTTSRCMEEVRWIAFSNAAPEWFFPTPTGFVGTHNKISDFRTNLLKFVRSIHGILFALHH